MNSRRAHPLRAAPGLLLRAVLTIVLAAYLVVSRAIAYVGALYVALYFLVGTSAFKGVVQDAISNAIPGFITAATVRWGPAPWQVHVADARIWGEEAEAVISVEALTADVDLLGTFGGMARFFTRDAAPLALHFDAATITRPTAAVRVLADGRVGIARAFTRDEDPPGPGPPMRFDIQVRAATVVNASGTVETPDFHLAATGLDGLATASITGLGVLAYHIPEARVAEVVNTFSARTRAGAGLAPVEIPARRVRIEGFSWEGQRFRWARARGRVDGGSFDSAGGFDVGATPPRWRGAARLELTDTTLPAPLRALLGEVVELGGAAAAPTLSFALDGAGDVTQAAARLELRADALVVAGVPLHDVDLVAHSLPRGVPGHPDAHAIAIERLNAGAFGGEVALHDTLFGPEDSGATRRGDELFGAVRLHGVRVDRVLAAVAPALGDRSTVLPESRPPSFGAFTATVDGVVTFGGTHTPAGAWSVATVLDDLTVDWTPSPEDAPLLPTPGRYVVGGTVGWEEGPPGAFTSAADGPLDRSSPPWAPTRRLTLERIAIDGRGDRVRLQGAVDLVAGVVDLEPYLRIGDIADDARRVGAGDLGGRLVLKAGRVTGPLAAPQVRATFSWSGARLGRHPLGHVVARLHLDGPTLGIHQARTSAPLGTFELDGQLQLFGQTVGALHPTLPFRVTRLTADDLQLGQLIPDLDLRAPVDISRARLSGELTRPLVTLVGQGQLDATSIELGGEPLQRLSARFDATAARVSLHDLSLVGRGGERVEGDLTFTRAGRRLHGTLRARELPLQAVRAIRRAAPSLRGHVSANLTLGGTLDRPSVIGRLTLGAINAYGVELGDAELDVQTLPSGTLDVSSASFFRGFELVDGSGVTFEGLSPAHVHLSVRGRGARLTDLVPAAARSGVQLTTSASATLDLWPGRRGKIWDLRLDAAPGELELSLPDQGSAWVNATPLALTQEQDATVLSPVAFTSVSTAPGVATSAAPPSAARDALHVCGAVDARGGLALELAGVADVGFARVLKDAFSVLDGRLRLEGLSDAPDHLPRCLAEAPHGVLRVTGRVDAPLVTGRLVPLGVIVIPRGFGREIRLVDGRGVDLRPGPRPDEQLIVSPPGRGLVGEVDDGVFSVRGELALVGLTADRADLVVVGTDLFYSSPGEFTATFNPTLDVRARRLAAAAPDLAVTGSVLVTDAHFTRSFDTFARALGSAIGGASSSYSRPISESAPWLAATHLDVDVTSSAFRIDSAFPLGHADMQARLDLTLGGTVGDPRVYRRIDLLPGGNLTYRVFRRDFEIRGGFVDFDGDADHPTLDVTAQTEVTYIARASSDTQDEDEKVVVIALRIHGRVPDLKIELSSDDSSFDQDDLQSLILTGRPRRDLDRSTGSSVVTADLAAVFNEVLRAPFVRTAAVGLSSGGDLRADVGTCFGPDLCFTTTAVQETAETTLRARFRLHLGDDLTCDGTLRRSDTTATAFAQETYEARCRYRIPLD